MTIIESNTEQHPYRGIQTFSEKHKDLFFGRTNPADEIFNLLKNNLLTVIFGKSGIGKSSLINAGLVPKLRENFYLPVLIRIPFSDATIDPLAYTKACIEIEIKKYILKGFTFPQNVSLWQFFREANYTGGTVIPILIFDQFEEYFNFGKQHRQRSEKFIKELADLIENRVPSQLTNTETYQFLNTADAQNIFRVVISLREDFLAPLEDLSKLIPSLNKVRYRIQQLHGEEAFDAVYQPAKNLIDEATAIHLLKKIIPKKIDAETDNDHGNADDKDEWKNKDFEPYILSLFCYQVNEKRILAKQDKISEALINQTKVETILDDYYISSLKKYWRKYHKRFGHVLEKNLLSDEGYRLPKPATSKEFKAIPAQAINDMVDDHILQRENRNETSYIEISHDLLAKVVYDRKIANRTSKVSILIGAGFFALLIFLLLFGYFKQRENFKIFNYALQKKDSAIKIQDSLTTRDSIKIKILNTQVAQLVTGDTSNTKRTGIVYFQVNWNPSQPQVLMCIQALRKLNFAVPAVEKKQTTPAKNLIRYYHPEDEINADLIKTVCDKIYAQPFTVQYIAALANRVKTGTMEVWVIYEHHFQQLFSDTSAVSQNAVNYLSQTYKTVDVNKQWPKKMVAYARDYSSDENGVYNTLLVFSKMDAAYLSNDKALILSWLKEVQQMNNERFTPLINAINQKLGG